MVDQQNVAKLSLNSILTSIEADLVLDSGNPATHPTGKVVTWNKTSNISIKDFKYFKLNWRLKVIQL